MWRSGGFGRPIARGQRGLVTVELAVGIVTATLLAGFLISLTMLGVAQAACAEASSQLARQLARGDDPAVQAARDRLPDGAKTHVNREESGIQVSVSAPVEVVALGSVTVRAESWAAYEPGIGP